MSQNNVSKTESIRVVPGTAEKIRAITGQPFSRVVRWLLDAYIAKHANETTYAKNAQAGEVRKLVDSLDNSTIPQED